MRNTRILAILLVQPWSWWRIEPSCRLERDDQGRRREGFPLFLRLLFARRTSDVDDDVDVGRVTVLDDDDAGRGTALDGRMEISTAVVLMTRSWSSFNLLGILANTIFRWDFVRGGLHCGESRHEVVVLVVIPTGCSLQLRGCHVFPAAAMLFTDKSTSS